MDSPSLPITKAAFGQHTIVLGKTRSGKSSKLRLIVERLLDEGQPVCIIDPKGDWWGLKSSASGREAGYPIIIFGGEHADVPINEHSGASIAELVATGNRPCIIDLGGWMVGERSRFFTAFAQATFKLTRGMRWLVIDECHNFAPQGRTFDVADAKMLHWANRIASEGAGKGITLLSASQRPQKVHKDYLTSHETLVACRVSHPLDRGAIKDWIDGCADPAVGKQVLADLAQMDRSEAYVWSPEIGFGPKKVKFPLFKTYDSFKPRGHDTPVALKGWASVDLDEVKLKLAAVMEEAKQNDPATLRQIIANLQRDLRETREASAFAGAVERDAEAHARTEGYRDGYESGWKEGWRSGGDIVCNLISAELKAAVDKARFEAKEPGPVIRALVPVPTTSPEEQARITDKFSAQDEAFKAVNPFKIPSRPRRVAPADNPVRIVSDDDLPKPQQRILDSLATWAAIGFSQPTNAQVAWLAGYSPSSTGYTNPRSALRTANLIEYPMADRVMLMPFGVKAGRPMNVDMTRLVDFVCGKISGPEGRILRAVAQHYPEPVTNAKAAEVAGYSPTSTGYTNPRSSLKTKDLITYPSPGTVRLADWLVQ